ncbi:MAG: hypothetical protein ABH950_01295, partial [Candidatus Altiarchaeota archaeon]
TIEKMTKGYDTALVSSYKYMHAHFGELLSIYSQPLTCKIMKIFLEEPQCSVNEFKKHIGPEVKGYALSRHLGMLVDKKLVERVGKIYILKNDMHFKRMVEASQRIHKLLHKKIPVNLSHEYIASCASLFSSLIYDDISDVLLHILLDGERPFKEIVAVYRDNHAYISANVLRYHLSRKEFEACGKRIQIFNFLDGTYCLTPEAIEIHNIFDEFMMGYKADNEAWMDSIWKKPLKELISARASIVHSEDFFYKVLRSLGKNHFVIVRTTQPEGTITIENAMNKMGEQLKRPGFWTNVHAKDLMEKLKKEDILKGEHSLMDVYLQRGSFDRSHYVVDLGHNTYGVLDLPRIMSIVNDT